jgi:hypothetical protein
MRSGSDTDVVRQRRYGLALFVALVAVGALLSWAVLGSSTDGSGYTTVGGPTGGVTLTIDCHTGFHRAPGHPYCVRDR